MAPTRRIVLDVLKPHDPELPEFADQVAGVGGVDAVNVSVIEIDKRVSNVKLTLEGENLEYDPIQDAITELGGTIHSIDEVVCGDYIVYEPTTSSLVRPAWLR